MFETVSQINLQRASPILNNTEVSFNQGTLKKKHYCLYRHIQEPTNQSVLLSGTPAITTFVNRIICQLYIRFKMFPKVIGTQKYFLRKVPCVQVYPLHGICITSQLDSVGCSQLSMTMWLHVLPSALKSCSCSQACFLIAPSALPLAK